MTRSNGQALRDFYAAVSEGDLDGAAGVFAPGIEIRTRLETFRGVDAAREMLEQGFVGFDASLDLQRVLEPEADQAVAVYRLTMRGRQSGIEQTQEVIDVVTFSDGLIERVEVFSDLDEALASLG